MFEGNALRVSFLFASVVAIGAYDATRQRGQTGQDVVDASVGQVQDSCIFSNDRQFMRRLAYAESQFGAYAPPDNLGGMWRLNETYFNKTLVSNKANQQVWRAIYANYTINYTAVSYANDDMSIPLDDALATRFYLSIANDSIPWTVQDQAKYYVKYYNTTSNAQYFLDSLKGLPNVCSSPGADVLFMLDGSGSIGTANFNLMKQFLLNITGSFQLGPDDYQIAVLVFSDDVVMKDYIRFNDYNWNETALQSLINKLTYPAGGTRTDLALDFALNKVFNVTVGDGVRPDTEGYPRVGIVITDGQSNDPQLTVTAAAADRSAGIVLFSVGIGGSVDNTELDNIASQPTCMHVYNLNDFAGLSQGFPEELKAQTCVAPAIIQPNQSVINNVVQQDQLMYFAFGVNASAGVTFEIAMNQGRAGLYLSTQFTHPSDVQYDFYVPPTSGQGSIYISPDDLTDQQSASAYLKSNLVAGTAVPLFASVQGAAAGNNNFTLFIYQGYHGGSSKSVSNFAFFVFFLWLAYLLQ